MRVGKAVCVCEFMGINVMCKRLCMYAYLYEFLCVNGYACKCMQCSAGDRVTMSDGTVLAADVVVRSRGWGRREVEGAEGEVVMVGL